MSGVTQTKLFEIIAKTAEVQPEIISLEMELEAFGVDSIGITELMFELEEQFSIEFVDDEDITIRLNSLRTVQDVVDIVNTLVSKKEEI